MAAKKGNKNGIKLKSPDLRQEAYKQYCDWIATGKPKEGWYFEHPQFVCCFKTMERYITENPMEFPIIHKTIAKSKAYNKWFDKGEAMVDGTQKNCQPAVYQMIMRNMFDWDKERIEQNRVVETLLEKMAKEWRRDG